MTPKTTRLRPGPVIGHHGSTPRGQFDTESNLQTPKSVDEADGLVMAVFFEMTLADRHDIAVANFGSLWFQEPGEALGAVRYLQLRRDEWDALGQPDTIRVSVQR